MNEAGESQISLGKRLLDAGWRQCSLIEPHPSHLGQLPPHLGFDPSRERLMVVTQSCSVCGESSKNERYVEVIVVELLAAIIPAHHGLALKGKMTRELVLPISGARNVAGIRCDIDRRCFLPRDKLLEWSLDALTVSEDQLVSFQGWMARYYVRIAVPTELVNRLTRCGFMSAVRKVLGKRLSEGGPQIHELLNRIYIRWSPNKELPVEESYAVRFIFACDEEDLVDDVEDRLFNIESFENGTLAAEGVEITKTDVVWIGNLTVLAAKGMFRFGSWDDMTGLGDYAQDVRGD